MESPNNKNGQKSPGGERVKGRGGYTFSNPDESAERPEATDEEIWQSMEDSAVPPDSRVGRKAAEKERQALAAKERAEARQAQQQERSPQKQKKAERKEELKEVKEVSLEAVGTTNSNLANRGITLYLNVGAWTGGQSSFGLVAGDTAALCSWLPRRPSPLRTHGRVTKTDAGNEHLFFEYKLAEPVATFLDEASRRRQGAAKYGFGPYLIACYKAPGGYKFVEDPNKLMLFMPDMHINVFKGFPIDGFRGPKSPSDEGNVSQAQYLADMLRFVKKYKENNDLEMWHLGDLYEMWHFQTLCVQAYKKWLIRKSEKNSKQNVDAFRRVCTLSFLVDLYGSRGDINWKTPRNFLDDRDWTAEQQRIYTTVPVPLDDQRAQEKFVRDFYNADGKGGMNAELWDLLTANYIRGNHDMERMSRYVELIFKDAIDLKTAKKHPTVYGGEWPHVDDPDCSFAEPADGEPRYGDGTDRMRWEHGHAFDWYNHDKSFHRLDKRKKLRATYMIKEAALPGGWWATAASAVKPAFNASNTGASRIPHPLDNLFYSAKKKGGDHFGDTVLEVFAHARAKRIFRKHRDIHLVVMGHTHVPDLSDWMSVTDPSQTVDLSDLEIETVNTAVDYEVDDEQELVATTAESTEREPVFVLNDDVD